MPSPQRRRLVGKSALGAVSSPLDLEARFGLRLRQVRRANRILGAYDVMVLADVEIGCAVSRDVALRWLEVCGAEDPSIILVRPKDARDLDSRFGSFMILRGFLDAWQHSGFESEALRFCELFPHVALAADVFAEWIRYRAAPVLPDLGGFVRSVRRRSVPSYDVLISRWGSLLDHIFAVAPTVTSVQVVESLRSCGADVSGNTSCLRDYLCLRRAGVRVPELVREASQRDELALLVDHYLYGCCGPALVVLSANRGRPRSLCALESQLRHRSCRTVSLVDVGGDEALRRDLHRLLQLHLVSCGVHRVCEEFLALHGQCLPFRCLHARLLGRLSRGPGKDHGRLAIEQCWRVLFAYVERCRCVAGVRGAGVLVVLGVVVFLSWYL